MKQWFNGLPVVTPIIGVIVSGTRRSDPACPCMSRCWHSFYVQCLYTTLEPMAKYGKTAERKVEKAMRERKRGTLKSGRSGKKVTSRKQAIAIGLSEARKRGAKVPAKKTGRTPAKKTGRKTGRKTARKSRSRS
jgi:hypothetical protein